MILALFLAKLLYRQWSLFIKERNHICFPKAVGVHGSALQAVMSALTMYKGTI